MASIMVIDDDAQVRAFVRLVLAGDGHEVREAGDGAEGIKAHRHRPADLILCDLFMPEKEGLETIRQLASEFPGVKVVAMTGGTLHLGGEGFLRMARALGAADALEKPLDGAAIVKAVRDVLQT